MILVVFAMREESAAFEKWLSHQDLPVEIAWFGVGEASTREKLPEILDNGRPELLICAGFAGALSEELALGEIFIATNATTIDPPGAGLHRAEIFSASQVIDDASDRLEMAIYSRAEAVDLESQTVAEIAFAENIPLLTIRVIVDTPDRPIPIPWEVSYDVVTQTVQRADTFRWLLRHPGKWWAFRKFLKTLTKAREDLAKSLISAIQEILQRSAGPS